MNSEPLASILAAKEERAGLRRQYAAENLVTISLNLNVPGYPKSNSHTSRFFAVCLDEFKFFLQANRLFIQPAKSAMLNHAAGEFFIAPLVSGHPDVSFVKQQCENFEETHTAGRFIDADVYDHQGLPVSSGKSKKCFYCLEKPAIECRRENRHDTHVLREFMFSEMDRYCLKVREELIIRKIASAAVYSALRETAMTPKPGLVDRLNNGSHEDMNFNTFLLSTASLAPYFYDLVRAGFEYTGDPALALPQIRLIGLNMEYAMYNSTGGVNTQKGLIFLSGISLFACGLWFRNHNKFDTGEFRKLFSTICRSILSELDEKGNEDQSTHGRLVYEKFGVKGIRQQAAEGLPLVFKNGVPELRKFDPLSDEALKFAFLAIASENDDTNILYRAGSEALETFKALARSAYTSKTIDSYNELIAYCKEKNISPGGSADLLAMSIFFHNITQEDFS